MVHTSVEHCIEEVGRDIVEDCIQDCGVEVAKDVICESFDIGDEEPCVETPDEEDFSINMDTIFLGLQSLRVYYFPKPKPHVWNMCAKKFLLPLPENAEQLRITRFALWNSILNCWIIRRPTGMIIRRWFVTILEQAVWPI